MILSLRDNNIRLGNICFILANQLKTCTEPIEEIICCHENLLVYKDLFNVKFSLDKNMSPIKYDWYNVLNFNNCDFDKLKEIINYSTLEKYNSYIPNEKYLCINCRYGDYLLPEHIKLGYKSFNGEIFSEIYKNYYKEFEQYNTIIIVSDDLEMAKKNVTQISNKNIMFYHIDHFGDLNILINANQIIGSCSTFSFLGYALNKNNAKLYVEYPYYYNYTPLEQLDGIYEHQNIIKHKNIC